MKPQSILVPVDDSMASIQALERAVGIASSTGARVRIFHALVHAADARYEDQDQRTWLSRAREAAAHRSVATGALDIDYMSRPGTSAFDAIAEACEEIGADLVVMGTHGGGLLMGSVAERLVRRAPCNVMVCRKDAFGDWPATPGTILVPVDFSDNALRAVVVARELAGTDDHLAFLHVVSTPEHPDVVGDEVPAPLHADPELEARLTGRVRSWIDDPGADVTAVEGDVVVSILDQAHAREAALVVMGTRGLTGFTRFVMGSVAEHVTRTCEAPVLTVR